MGWFTPKCPRCNGELQETDYCAPYASHRCPACIEKHRLQQQVKELADRVKQLEKLGSEKSK